MTSIVKRMVLKVEPLVSVSVSVKVLVIALRLSSNDG